MKLAELEMQWIIASVFRQFKLEWSPSSLSNPKRMELTYHLDTALTYDPKAIVTLRKQ